MGPRAAGGVVVTAFLAIALALTQPVSLFLYKDQALELLRGKTVLITGASAGIGRALAFSYAEKGSSLILVGRRSEALRKVAETAIQRGAANVQVVAYTPHTPTPDRFQRFDTMFVDRIMLHAKTISADLGTDEGRQKLLRESVSKRDNGEGTGKGRVIDVLDIGETGRENSKKRKCVL
eukprot:jgi/Bigna1/79484/fgenesh1_pg.62_\